MKGPEAAMFGVFGIFAWREKSKQEGKARVNKKKE